MSQLCFVETKLTEDILRLFMAYFALCDRGCWLEG